jgi:hypothetical protein
VEKFLKAGVMEEGEFQPTRVGTPQGGVISPLLANIALNVLDWHLQEHGYHFVRYADDFVVLCRSQREDEGDAVPRWVRLSGLRHPIELRKDACQVGGELQDESPRDYSAQPQSGCRSNRATEPHHPGHGELLRYAMVSLRRCIPQPGPLDSHATAVHETQTEIGEGQLPNPPEALQAHRLTFAERPPTYDLVRSRIALVPQNGATSTEPPGAGNPHAGKYEELTSLR